MEFLSRVRAALRRSAPEARPNVLTFHEILLDNAIKFTPAGGQRAAVPPAAADGGGRAALDAAVGAAGGMAPVRHETAHQSS